MLKEAQYVNQHFGSIPVLIKDIEKETYDTSKFLIEIRKMWQNFNSIPNISEEVLDHFAKVFNRNKGYKTISDYFSSAGVFFSAFFFRKHWLKLYSRWAKNGWVIFMVWWWIEVFGSNSLDICHCRACFLGVQGNESWKSPVFHLWTLSEILHHQMYFDKGNCKFQEFRFFGHKFGSYNQTIYFSCIHQKKMGPKKIPLLNHQESPGAALLES